MTSSLVGSEMCIRDSPTWAGATAAMGRAGPGPLAHTRPELATATAAEPVSYTHLTLPTICSV
eukprot:8394608-Prorocentrum_lima.AAC.1